jgi:hypothetical protein
VQPFPAKQNVETPIAEAPAYCRKLAQAGADHEQNWLNFQKLNPAQQKLQALYDFFAILNTVGLDYNNASSPYYHQYSNGYEAVNALFRAAYGYTQNALTGGTNGANQLVHTGDLDLRGSTIQTQQGGNISILGPGGRILVGSAVASPAVDPASEGILTLESGNIATFTDTDVLVAQSRVMTISNRSSGERSPRPKATTSARIRPIRCRSSVVVS